MAALVLVLEIGDKTPAQCATRLSVDAGCTMLYGAVINELAATPAALSTTNVIPIIP